MPTDDRCTPSLEEFFADVDRARAHLERKSHSASLVWERLRGLAGEMLKSRSADELIIWFTQQLHRALGARGLVTWVLGDSWQIGHQTGELEVLPEPPQSADLVVRGELEPLGVEPGAEGCVWIGLRGTGEPVAAVWIRGAPPLEGQTLELLLAFCDTVGLLLEQTLAASALRRGSPRGQNEPIEK